MIAGVFSPEGWDSHGRSSLVSPGAVLKTITLDIVCDAGSMVSSSLTS